MLQQTCMLLIGTHVCKASSLCRIDALTNLLSFTWPGYTLSQASLQTTGPCNMHNVGLSVQNGQSIISGWSDGKIRAFGPQSGKLLYTIHEAHQGAVTAISATPDSTRIISGGEEGMVRMWAIHPKSQVMTASMKVRQAVDNFPRLG